MNWFGLILVIYIVHLNLFLAYADVCSSKQYRNASGDCVECTECNGLKNLVILPCDGHADTVCGSDYNPSTLLPEFQKHNKRKNKDDTVKLNLSVDSSKTKLTNKKSFVPKKQTEDDSYDYDDDYDDDYGPVSEAKIGKKTTLSIDNKKKKPKKVKSKSEFDESASVLKNSYLELSSAKKLGFNKNGKHIKKDLSMSDSVNPIENLTSIEYSVKSRPVESGSKNHAKKSKGKAKKNSVDINDHSVTIGDTKFVINNEEKSSVSENQLFGAIYPHIENHHIYVDMEDHLSTDKKGSTMFASKSNKRNSSKQLQDYIGEISEVMANDTYVQRTNKKLKSKGHALDLMVEVPSELGNETGLQHPLSSNKSDIINISNADLQEILKKHYATINFDDNSNENNIDERNDGDGDDDEDDDESDEDDDDDDDEDEEGDDTDEDEDEDEDEDDDEDYTFSGVQKKHKVPPFGRVNSGLLDSDDETEKIDEDDDYNLGGYTPKDTKGYSSGENDVNVEPYLTNSDWQLLTFVSAASACLLFFIVINAYICIYMKKWKHLKTNFEADVEDLSVRINLMQHAGFEQDESNHIKNYITHLKGATIISEKLPKASLREK